MDKTLGLYLHMPFCKSKCAYCDFYSVTDCHDYRRYANAIALQMGDYSDSANKYMVDTIFMGGGTPSLMPRKHLFSIFDGIYDSFNVDEDCEFTMEVNPATIDGGMLKTIRREGVNRLSIGMQSANDAELKALSRIHDYEDFELCYKAARKAKFDNINIDVMYGIPEQTLASFHETLDKVGELHPEHISLYGLKVEPNTPFGERAAAGQLVLPDEDTEFEMYSTAIDILSGYGYKQYEISNFALPGHECRHNLKYWDCKEYLGFGPAAHSYFGGRRFSYKRDVELYMNTLEGTDGSDDIIDEDYVIDANEQMNEYIMLRLRLKDGIDSAEFNSRYGLSFENIFGDYLNLYCDNGFMEKRGTRYSFTTKGMFVSNYILSTMLDFSSASFMA